MKTHTITFGVQNDYVEYTVECPWEPDDPERPCRMFDMEPGESTEGKDPIDGCGVQSYLTEGGPESIHVPDVITSLPVPVDVAWDQDGPVVRPFGTVLRIEIAPCEKCCARSPVNVMT